MSTTTTVTDAAPITAQSILRLFPEIDTTSAALEGHDEEQIRLMDEVCIVLDENDKPIGTASKKLCHLMTNIDKGLLHRAFSVFLFDDKNRLLLQQRASEKITFPDMWTNTCCSHPLSIPGETGSDLPESVDGVKRAAQRKLDHELGIKTEQVPFEDFRFLTRIHYKAPSDGKWGEHEIDYILFIKANVDVDPNKNEVQDTKYVSPEDLKALFADPKLKFTPWFKLICESMLFEWWQHLDSGLEKYTDEQEIRRVRAIQTIVMAVCSSLQQWPADGNREFAICLTVYLDRQPYVCRIPHEIRSRSYPPLQSMASTTQVMNTIPVCLSTMSHNVCGSPHATPAYPGLLHLIPRRQIPGLRGTVDLHWFALIVLRTP
ncbi:hypothetical protein SCAR479_06503 [Seiridium cardinale]|uniref:isopentenyl-diphosphate Delta-isomerase n=1 Tax=Seiridium cardinale TaxID=138064 RepID=A0ABR2XSV0_9PEZI